MPPTISYSSTDGGVNFDRAAAYVLAKSAESVQAKRQQSERETATRLQQAMFDTLLAAANRIAIGSNNSTGQPARGRLLHVLNRYVVDDGKAFDEKAFCRLLTVEFRGIPASAHPGLFQFVSRNKPTVSLAHLLETLIPEGFTRERGVLDYPTTVENVAVAKKETLEEAAEEIRAEMIRHLRAKRLGLRDYFDRIDANGSGTLDSAELVAFLRHDNLGIGRYHACKSLVCRFDRGGRGKLAFGDFEQMMTLVSLPGSYVRLDRLGRSPVCAGGERTAAGTPENHGFRSMATTPMDRSTMPAIQHRNSRARQVAKHRKVNSLDF